MFHFNVQRKIQTCIKIRKLEFFILDSIYDVISIDDMVTQEVRIAGKDKYLLTSQNEIMFWIIESLLE